MKKPFIPVELAIGLLFVGVVIIMILVKVFIVK